MNLKSIAFFFVLLFFCHFVYSQEEDSSQAGILFYNVENLFNPENNEGKNDEEFLPDGVRRWTHFRKNKKLNNIARVILHAGKWNPPVLVGLCEIEDRKVLEQLIWNTGLNHLHYFIEHYESPDQRGIDVALLYRNNRFEVLDSKPIPVVLENSERPTRDILYVRGVLDKKDTLHLMINHWPSRWGGEGTTRFKRISAARVLDSLCHSVLKTSSDAKIIAMGDFNDGPENESMTMIGRFGREGDAPLVNLAFNARGPVRGTIKYKHEWSCFDQILVSESLMSDSKVDGFKLGEDVMQIVAPDFLLEDDPVYPGRRLKRTYLGFKYVDGYSDHLPVMIHLVNAD